MKMNLTIQGKPVKVEENPLDRAIRWLAPAYGLKRFRARTYAAIAGGYTGGRRDRNATKQWVPRGNDPDTDIIADLPDLRGRSRDANRNNPIAAGATNTDVVNVVGAGLQLHANIDAALLNMTEDEADAWEANTQRWFRLWANNPNECDLARTLTFGEKQNLVYRQTLENGDVFVNKPYLERPGCYFGLKLQEIEADRVCNKDLGPDTETLSAGVEFSLTTGEPLWYHIARFHPGSLKIVKREWDRLPVFNREGKRNIYHLYKTLRPEQHRGVPSLAPVLEALKQISNLTESELQASVLQSVFTAFLKTEGGDGELKLTPSDNSTENSTEDSITLGSGNILGLQPGQDVVFANPTRPNNAFEPFFISVVQQIGTAIGMPYEVLMKRFTASYSAARAALMEAWKFFMASRAWLVTRYCQPVYCDWMDEAVARDMIQASGYFDNPLIRQAYRGAMWIGPAKGMIQEQAEVGAANDRVTMGISTLEYEAAQIMGLDWEGIHPQQVKERRMRRRDGLDTEPVAGRIATEPQEPKPAEPDPKQDKKEDETEDV